MIDQEIKETLIEAGVNNDVDAVMDGLTALGIRREPNELTNIYKKFRDLGQFILGNREEAFEYKGIMRSLLINSLYNNNLELCHFLIESKELRINADIKESIVWKHGLNSGNMDSIKYLIKSSKINNTTKAQFLLNELGSYSAQENYLEVLQYLLTDSSIPIRREIDQEFKNIYDVGESVINNDIFVNSCRKNNTSAINFLLEHKDYSKIISFMSFYRGILIACQEDRLEIVDFLLHDKKIPFKLDIDYDLLPLLKSAVKGGATNVLTYLILDLNMSKPDNLDELLSLKNLEEIHFILSSVSVQANIMKVMETRDFVNQLFEKRELIESLNSNLNINPTSNKPKRKI